MKSWFVFLVAVVGTVCVLVLVVRGITTVVCPEIPLCEEGVSCSSSVVWRNSRPCIEFWDGKGAWVLGACLLLAGVYFKVAKQRKNPNCIPVVCAGATFGTGLVILFMAYLSYYLLHIPNNF